jgi:release factor H-coupled RctB family protein
VVRGYQEKHGYAGIHPDSDDARSYLSAHDHAVKWGRANRALIASRFLAALGSDARTVLDLPHNFVADYGAPASRAGQRWVHRKGANPSNQGAAVIPGSRGALSYLVMSRGDQEANAYSLAHGAGRKWNRHDCRSRLRDRFDEESLLRTDLGSRVICEDRDLLYEEAPQAYKDIAMVVKDLVDAGLVSVIATLRPLITYKLRRAIHGRKD